MTATPNDLNILKAIPEDHIADGRHQLAECQESDCRNRVRYSMTVEDYPSGYDTIYFCEEHKPKT